MYPWVIQLSFAQIIGFCSWCWHHWKIRFHRPNVSLCLKRCICNPQTFPSMLLVIFFEQFIMEAGQCQTTLLLLKCCEHWPINGRYFWESVAQGTLYEPHHQRFVGGIYVIWKEILCNSFFGLDYYQNFIVLLRANMICHTWFRKLFQAFPKVFPPVFHHSTVSYSHFILWYGQEDFIALITPKSYSVTSLSWAVIRKCSRGSLPCLFVGFYLFIFYEWSLIAKPAKQDILTVLN